MLTTCKQFKRLTGTPFTPGQSDMASKDTGVTVSAFDAVCDNKVKSTFLNMVKDLSNDSSIMSCSSSNKSKKSNKSGKRH